MKSKLIYLSVFFTILIFINFLKEIVFYVNEFLSHFVCTLYVLPWIVLVTIIIVNSIRKIEGIKPWEFIFISSIVGALISILSFFLNMSLGFYDSLEKNYVGVYGTTTGFDNSTESEIVIEHKTNVFRINDISVKQELVRLENEYEEASKINFIFWQTAFAYGFQPDNIYEFKGTDSFGKLFTLIFTVGPIFLLETFINSIMETWILLLFPIIGLFFNKKIFEKQLNPFIEYFTKRFTKTE